MRTPIIALALACLVLPTLTAADWTTWRADSARSGFTEDSLPKNLNLAWTWHPVHAPRPAWPRDDRMSFDRTSHVVVANGHVCFGSSVDGTVTALDAATGAMKWKFFTGGPIRFAPTVWKDRIFVTSDDGYLYSVKMRTGEVIDRWRGGSGDDRVLGNTQIISKWPARGGTVIHDGVLYWAAGIWQSEGVYIHAMNPDTSELLWTNAESGGMEMPQPHGGANAKSGVSAQGYLLANDERLFVPTGRAVPAVFQRSAGKFEYYRLQENTRSGDTTAVLYQDLFYNGGYAYQTEDGSVLADRVAGTVATHPDGIIHATANQLHALTVGTRESVDRRGNTIHIPAHETRWQAKDIPAGTSLIVAGDTVVTSGVAQIATADAATGTKIWSHEVDDVAYGLAVADGRLYVSTASGAIHCFADASAVREAIVLRTELIDSPYGDNGEAARAARDILKASKITAGYCIDLGCGDGRLACELVRQSDLYVVGIEADETKVADARRRLEAAGLYGSRVTIHQGDPSKTYLPKFIANLIVSSQSLAAGGSTVASAEVSRLQRPFGGVTCFGSIDALKVDTRGALEGAGDWTHMYSNPANTLCSTDTIKGPLTAVWFRDIDLDLPQRHGRGPSPLFHEGRLFAEGLDELIAVDAYNGRPLWRFEQEGILDAYNADHLAGSAITGSNICIAGDSIYLRNSAKCLRIDTATGRLKSTFQAPAHPDGTPASWGFVACQDGV
ncbi:MAG: PQQ-binding-like beta-propeller repeat protein, partial [Planctomycetota bacterium]|nr:PQQ-binding-like beta-propeller repeat protein [Planctomycetota bacterium]